MESSPRNLVVNSQAAALNEEVLVQFMDWAISSHQPNPVCDDKKLRGILLKLSDVSIRTLQFAYNSKRLQDTHTQEKVAIRNFLGSIPGKIGLTTDLWAAVRNRSFAAVTAHFVDFVPVEASHTAVNDLSDNSKCHFEFRLEFYALKKSKG